MGTDQSLAVQSWKHCRESVKCRTKIMWNRKSFISLLCMCVVAVNPVFAAHAPCCCTKQADTTPSQCHAHASKTQSKSCCSRKSAPLRSVKERCQCCVKSLPQSAPAKSPQFKTSVDVAIALWKPQQSLTTANSVAFSETEGPCGLSGPKLLALYCRWLE